jgi:hypothetical protein
MKDWQKRQEAALIYRKKAIGEGPGLMSRIRGAKTFSGRLTRLEMPQQRPSCGIAPRIMKI